MGDPAERVPTFEELRAAIEALPETLTAEILEPGVISTMSRPGGKHRFTQRRIVRALGSADEGDGGRGWWLENEPAIRFPLERLLVPDVAGWRAPDEVPPAFVDENPILVLPHFACEILSRSTQRDDRRVKLPLYASSGVEHVWLVDPELRLIEVYESRSGAPVQIATARDADVVTLAPFAFEIDLAAWWKPAPRAR
ncbi:MAG: Uma2 family endonuclease [Myxococcota bacterium]|nr:Uma2 family endonuclease [Myxococcota bacterium]